ncbi:Wzy polymerase domain-containing protein [Ramlibacter tataouinensis]|uniref:Wzy polymerase domain-containing protein n=1 Tax=Ramlibacter tataouinensis TaxID=94132 RepID=UPI0022F3BCA6|nr:Wzy polymerase domain-containing protein [Ramlibacter tataouinensis]WBY00110.1 Wzy polymerase domain-containing protein [Ramlibacter tataouinensis]
MAWGCAMLALAASAERLRAGAWAAGILALAAVAVLAGRSAGPQALALLAALLAAAACAAAVKAARDPVAALRAIACGWLLAALASSAMALLQYAGWSAAFAPWITAADAGTAYANLRQRNQFATLTSIGLCALLWLGGGRPRLAAAGVLLLACGNAATASRAGLLQWMLLLLLVLAWRGAQRRQWLRLLALGLAAYSAAALLLPLALQWATGEATDNVFGRLAPQAACSTRTFLVPNVLELIATRPLSGWGWGELDYAHYWHLYAQPRFCDILDNAHNLPLHLAVELGLPTALLLTGATIWLVARQRPWRETQAHRQVAWMVLGCIGLHSLVEYPLWYGPFQMAAGFAIGALWTSRPGDGRPSTGSGARWAIAIAALACLVGAAYDYARVSQAYLPPERRWDGWRQDPVAQARDSWLFRDQVDFAELTLTPVTPQNAAAVQQLALRMLHFSPEPAVIEKLLESTLLVGSDDLLAEHLARYRAAFPEAYRQWMDRHAAATPPASPPTSPRASPAASGR